MQDNPTARVEAAPGKALLYEVNADEAGMRLDRWLKRRFPGLPQSHLMKIVRKGAVRVAGKRADIATRLEAGQAVRAPALPLDAEAIRAMTLYEDDEGLVLNKPYGLAVQGGSGMKRHIDGMLEALSDRRGRRPLDRKS